MTTANPTTRIDLGKLAADLTAAGWTRTDHDYYIQLVSGTDSIEIMLNEDAINLFTRFWINVRDEPWCTALELIAKHTQEAPE